MNRMEALEDDIAQLQDRLAARSDLINREVETVGPVLGLLDTSRTQAGVKSTRMTRAAQDHPIASAISALSTFYVAAQETGLIDRLSGAARRAKAETKVRYAEYRDSADDHSADTGPDLSTRARTTTARAKVAASDAVDGMSDRASELADRAAIEGKVAYAKSKNFVEENPVALGLLAAGIGAAAASFLMMGRRDEEEEIRPLPRKRAPVVTRRPRAVAAAQKGKPVPAKTVRPTKATKSAKASAAAIKSADKKPSTKTEATRHLGKAASKGSIPASKLANSPAGAAPANTASTTARPVDEIFRG